MATSIEQLLKQQRKALAGQKNKDIKSKEEEFNLNVGALEDNFNAETAQTEQKYNELYDQNAVNRIVNERKIAENMANSGLTDSGLNRTQQTANQLSYSNTNNQISIEKQKAIDTLALAMRNKRTELEIKKNQDIASIESGYEQLAMQNAVSARNAELDAEVMASQNAAQRKEQMYDDYYGSGGVLEFLNETKEVKDEYGDVISEEPLHSDKEKADRVLGWMDLYIDDYTNQTSVKEIESILSKLPDNIKVTVRNELNKRGLFFYDETPAVKAFMDKLPSGYEFYTIWARRDDIRSKYIDNRGGGYKKYVEDMIEQDKSLTENDIATILQILKDDI